MWSPLQVTSTVSGHHSALYRLRPLLQNSFRNRAFLSQKSHLHIHFTVKTVFEPLVFSCEGFFNRKKIFLLGHYLYFLKSIVFFHIWTCYRALVSGCCIDPRSLNNSSAQEMFFSKGFQWKQTYRLSRIRLCIGLTLKQQCRQNTLILRKKILSFPASFLKGKDLSCCNQC